jgi:F-box/leucine-rich repeat protein 2/20
VKHVVENCTQLREINLAHCCKVWADIADNMVHSRPSLRKIISPSSYHLSDKKRKLFLNRGCHVF